MIERLNDLSHLFLLLILTTAMTSCIKKDSIPSHYLVKKIKYADDYRTDITYSLKDGDSLKQTNKEKFRLIKGGLNKVIKKGSTPAVKPYMTTLDTECIEFLFENEMDDVLATTLCFLGKEDIIIGDKKYRDVYKFKKFLGLSEDYVESIVYYDSDFILLKEEYVSGYTDEYRIIRLDKSIKTPD
jgi:hypothetical protein